MLRNEERLSKFKPTERVKCKPSDVQRSKVSAGNIYSGLTFQGSRKIGIKVGREMDAGTNCQEMF